MELLKTLYEVLGASYPRLSIGVAAILGALFFGGSWWLIGKQYEADQRKTVPVHSEVDTSTKSENQKNLKSVDGDARTELPDVDTEVEKGYSQDTGLEDPLQAKLTTIHSDIQKLRYGTDKDAALKKIIALGITERRPELVITYVSELRYGVDKDKAYMTLIDLLIEMGNLEQASSIIQMLRYGPDRDKYTKRLLEIKVKRQ